MRRLPRRGARVEGIDRPARARHPAMPRLPCRRIGGAAGEGRNRDRIALRDVPRISFGRRQAVDAGAPAEEKCRGNHK